MTVVKLLFLLTEQGIRRSGVTSSSGRDARTYTTALDLKYNFWTDGRMEGWMDRWIYDSFAHMFAGVTSGIRPV